MKEPTKITLHVEEFPVVYKTDKGNFVTTKVLMDTEDIRAIPFVGTDEFSTIDEAIEDAGDGVHVVNWKVNLATYVGLTKSKKHPAPCFFGAWTVEVRGITCKRWTNNTTGDTGVSFKFVGLRPVSIEDGEESIRPEELEVVDKTADEDND